MKDLHSHVKVVSLIGAAVHSAAIESDALDIDQYGSVEIVIAMGVGGDTFTATKRIDVVLTDSDDNSAYAEVETADVLGNSDVTAGVIKSFQAAHAAAAVYRFGYKGSGKYLKAALAFNGSHTAGTPLAVIAVLSHGVLLPEDDQA